MSFIVVEGSLGFILILLKIYYANNTWNNMWGSLLNNKKYEDIYQAVERLKLKAQLGLFPGVGL